MSKKPDINIINQYFENSKLVGDKEKFFEWVCDPSNENDLRNHFQDIWKKLYVPDVIEGYNGTKIFEDIYDKILQDQSKKVPRISKTTRILQFFTKAAAVLLLPLLTYVIVNEVNRGVLRNNEAYAEIYAPLGTRTNFTLPDGTTGWLNSDSKIKFPVRFRGKDRRIELSGEAYFDVNTNPNRPFVVSGSSYEVTALGTTFNIYDYPGVDQVRITLVSGIVKVSSLRNGINENFEQLQPGQMLTYDVNSSKSEIQQASLKKETAWTEGQLVFRDDPFSEVVKKINRWYNVELVIMDKRLESSLYRATFQDETIEEVLNLFKLSAPIEYNDLGRELKPDGTYEKRRIEIYYKL